MGSNVSSHGHIVNCYATGGVSGVDDFGGVVGVNDWSGSIAESYWDRETSGLGDMCGAEAGGASGCDNGNGKNTLEMQQQATFANWDFVSEVVNGEDEYWRL